MNEWISVATDSIIALSVACIVGLVWNVILTVLVLYAIHRKPNAGIDAQESKETK